MTIENGLSIQNQGSRFMFKPIFADHSSQRYLFATLDGYTTIHLYVIGKSWIAEVHGMPYCEMNSLEALTILLNEHFPQRSQDMHNHTVLNQGRYFGLFNYAL